jgi:hypothetical protein
MPSTLGRCLRMLSAMDISTSDTAFRFPSTELRPTPRLSGHGSSSRGIFLIMNQPSGGMYGRSPINGYCPRSCPTSRPPRWGARSTCEARMSSSSAVPRSGTFRLTRCENSAPCWTTSSLRPTGLCLRSSCRTSCYAATLARSKAIASRTSRCWPPWTYGATFAHGASSQTPFVGASRRCSMRAGANWVTPACRWSGRK